MASPRHHQVEPRYTEYDLGDGWRALAGKTDADNETLSLKVARANDWWFHVRGMPGSHVILQGPDGAEAGKDLLKRGAAVAAYHSKARDGGLVAVSCTQGKHVSKPRGAKVGTVTIKKETVLMVRPAVPGASPETSR